ncbi:microfibril-associated glycoprotein 4-like isoform X2 [Eriocheir sinensis]|uniref:microfibril-associated glycoprotein 4-like isoform X2 n=1 Tax=Eriocheir sinensis TaxID=95602 RepID=UPI0021C80C23|nr:microfibril-associated glycoprotein 4-like isoform X2 [Eriocheir sinensis]
MLMLWACVWAAWWAGAAGAAAETFVRDEPTIVNISINDSTFTAGTDTSTDDTTFAASTDSTTDDNAFTTSPTSSETSTPETPTTRAVITTIAPDELPTATTPPPRRAGLPVDCADHLMGGATVSGVYEIYPFTCTCGRSVQVWCDMETDGGGWTVFLNRQNQASQLDFNRTWDEYKEGFGRPYEEYWMGLETLHVMTFGRTYSLRLDLEVASSGLREYATHAIVKVEDEDTGYKIVTSGTEAGSSNSRYCFRYMNYRSFTTVDRDYDYLYNDNCAAAQGGAWWYYNCKYFNPTSTYDSFIALNCYGTSERNVTSLQVKIRPAICDTSLKTIHAREMSCGC